MLAFLGSAGVIRSPDRFDPARGEGHPPRPWRRGDLRARQTRPRRSAHFHGRDAGWPCSRTTSAWPMWPITTRATPRSPSMSPRPGPPWRLDHPLGIGPCRLYLGGGAAGTRPTGSSSSCSDGRGGRLLLRSHGHRGQPLRSVRWMPWPPVAPRLERVALQPCRRASQRAGAKPAAPEPLPDGGPPAGACTSDMSASPCHSPTRSAPSPSGSPARNGCGAVTARPWLPGHS